MNTKVIIIPVVVVALIIGAIFYSTDEDVKEVSDKTFETSEKTLEGPEKTQETSEKNQEVSENQFGVIEGIVYFVGKPCPPNRVGPPCDGPYPNYEVVIYEIDGKTVFHRTITDDKGNFELQLPIGDYLAFEIDFGFNQIEEIPIEFSIEPEKIKNIKISIDKGIR